MSNILKIAFGGSKSVKSNPLYQYDYGQKILFVGLSLPSAYEVHFSNYDETGESKTSIGDETGAIIPDEYLVTGLDIYAWIFLHTGASDGETKYKVRIPVNKRARPSDTEPTPVQQDVITQAIALLNAGIAQADQSAQTATEQAGIAQSAATTATEAATRAEGAVDAVEAAATRAETAADGAEASATAAEASATDAEAAKTAALAAKGAAETAATNAEQSATDAGNYAGLAEAAEQDAQAAKTAAEASATAAAGSASAASGSASQAAQKASEASESATAAETSATNTEAARTGAETAQAAAETAQASAEEAAANAEQSATTAEWYAERVERFLPTDTASGAIATFPDGSDGVPVESLTVSMEPIQDLHGQDTPYPPGGGKNKLENNLTSREINGLTVTVDANGVISFSGTTTAVTILVIKSGIDTELQKNTGYVLSGCTGGSFATYRLEIYKQVGNNAVNYNGDTQFQIYDTDSGCICRIVIQLEINMSGIKIYPMIRLATETDATFAPYSNICPISGRDSVTVWREASYDPSADPALTIQLGDTVYAGTLDVVSGELTVDRAKKTLSQNDSFALSQSATRNRIVWNGYESVGKIGGLFVSNALKSMPASSGGYGTSDWAIWGSTVAPRCWISVPLSYTIDDFKEFLSSDPIEIVYELATPTTYHLTPQEVRTLLGDNNVWSDAGSVTVTYKADVQLYIDKRISALS